MKLRVIVVDDTITYRSILADILKEFDYVELLATANTGSVALSKIASLQPDLVTLDQEMPDMTGLEVLERMKEIAPNAGAIMVSSHTAQGGEITIRALELGAFDFVTKPSGGSREEMRRELAEALQARVLQFHRQREIRLLTRGGAGSPVATRAPAAKALPPRPARAGEAATGGPLAARPAASGPVAGSGPVAAKGSEPKTVELVAIGISTGGPNALAQVIPQLPTRLGVPVLLVQHMPPLFTGYLAQSLNDKSALTVKEAEDGELALADHVYIAPGGRHIKVRKSISGRMEIAVTDDPPENNCRPAVDVLFRSIALQYPASCCAVIMTGMGRDGTLGLRLLKRQGAWVIGQDAASCVVYGMPKEAVDAGVVDEVQPLTAIAAAITKAVGRFR